MLRSLHPTAHSRSRCFACEHRRRLGSLHSKILPHTSHTQGEHDRRGNHRGRTYVCSSLYERVAWRGVPRNRPGVRTLAPLSSRKLTTSYLPLIATMHNGGIMHVACRIHIDVAIEYNVCNVREATSCRPGSLFVATYYCRYVYCVISHCRFL